MTPDQRAAIQGDGTDDDGQMLRVSSTRRDLVTLNNALNEVCNGIEIEDFEFSTRRGVEREDARRLLKQITASLDDAVPPVAINDHQGVLDAWPGLLKEYPTLLAVSIAVGEDERSTEMTWTLGAASGETVRVRFGGVEDLAFFDLRMGESLGVLVLHDLRSRGWDRLRFGVEDPEQDDLVSFNCVSIEIGLEVHRG